MDIIIDIITRCLYASKVFFISCGVELHDRKGTIRNRISRETFQTIYVKNEIQNNHKPQDINMVV